MIAAVSLRAWTEIFELMNPLMPAFRRFGNFPFQPVVKEVEASIRGNQNLLNGVPCNQQRDNNY